MSPIDPILRHISPEAEQRLLEQFVPTLHFDALERWRPGPVGPYLTRAAVLDGSEQALPDTPPAEPAMKEHGGEPKARLNPLPKERLRLDDQIRSNELLGVFGPDQGFDGGGTAYGRVEAQDGGFFLQYWLFYADNPCVLPPGRHDGDWELVQVRVERAGGGFAATQVTLAEHGKPVTMKVEAGPAGHGPEVFVAVDSHACYFKSGSQPMLPLSDICQPQTTVGVKPAVVPFPFAAAEEDWMHWAGRWGMDGALGTRVALGLGLKRTPRLLRRLNFGAGESPPSPGLQKSWPSPEAFARSGTRRKWTAVAVRRLAHLIGKLTWPSASPKVSVEGTGEGRYTVEARPAGRFLRRIVLVSVAFDEVATDGTRRALAMYSVETEKPPKTFDIPHQGELVWCAAGYNRLRQRGEPVRPPAQ
jgi:hypothetical protein